MNKTATPLPGQIGLFEAVCPLCHKRARLVTYGRKGWLREACEACLHDRERKAPAHR